MLTDASHMITPLSSLDNIFALSALSIVEIVFKKINLVFIAFSLMLWEHTFLTEDLFTFIALGVGSINQGEDAIFTFLAWT